MERGALLQHLEVQAQRRALALRCDSVGQEQHVADHCALGVAAAVAKDDAAGGPIDGGDGEVIVDGDAGDAVNLEPSGLTGWTQGADESIGGVLYATYSAGLASVYVDADVGVTLV